MDALGIVMRLGQGHLLEEFADALQRTAEDVVETGQAGTVTLKVKVSPTGEVGNPMVAFLEELSRSAPKRKPRGAFLFAVDGALHKSDPRQTAMDFRDVNHGAIDVRNAETGAPVVREA